MQEQYIWIDTYGNKYYYKDREMTMLHRLDGPAIERADGTKEWYVDGKRHRLDGPAYEQADGYKEWYVDGKLHRLDGPAIEWSNGSKEWYVDGKLHRLDGPAMIWANGDKEWWVDGECLTEEKFLALTAPLELTLEDIASKFGVDVSKVKIMK
jgi:hypothetical protein